jgi:dolichyl-phosphate beta-glucosyltransferase
MDTPSTSGYREGRPIQLVFPFYNEAARLQSSELLKLATDDLQLVLVDDGSTDETLVGLKAAASASAGIRVLTLPINRGKAEAVRLGMLDAIRHGAEVVGYADGDLATPVEELRRLCALLRGDPNLHAVLGARVQMADRKVERRAARHYLGRVIATYLDARTGLGVYDTQCGAKVFRVDTILRSCLKDPFVTRWLFDVELLVRMRRGHHGDSPMRLREEPLETWVDIDGSKLHTPGQVLRVLADFRRLERTLRAGESARAR